MFGFGMPEVLVLLGVVGVFFLIKMGGKKAYAQNNDSIYP
jgi:hypothetical protein